MNLLITRALPDSVVEDAQARFNVTLRASSDPMTEREAAEALGAYDAILCTIGDAFTARTFAGDLRCKLLANFGVGYNHIDAAAAHAAGVAVTNTPGAVTDATADIALTLMLMVCRRAGEGERMLRRGEWGGWTPTQLLGTHMSGKRLGIVGMGRIGQAVARRAHFGFGMEIGFFNRSPKQVDVPATQMPDLPALLGWADLVVIAVPGGGESRHLINAETLAAMGPDSYLINVARGDVVDEAALIDALQTGRIKGAGLDVYEQEPTVPEALIALENVTLLPHLGTAALEVREAMGRMALSNVIAMSEGRALVTPV
ncbi:MAG: D-glycerate dehydrogenase [Rhodobacterales bacterium]|nr:MAG: D-glycerate dehydrogenase [Rhodobacterales bacterium]